MDNTCPYDGLLLPHDVLIQILLCQPVISLLRFKSVCKSWRDLIESSFFIHLHVAATTKTLCSSFKFGTFIFYTRELQNINKIKREILMLSSSRGDDNEQVFEVKSLGFPPHYKVFPKTHDICMVGSCNGLICLHDSVLKEFSLWNPATKQFRILPKSLLEVEGSRDRFPYFVAFGFDIKTKDYKVIHSTYLETSIVYSKSTFQVQVYSLSTDSWRLLEGINFLPRTGLYLNGCYIFMGMTRSEGQKYMIFSFDFTKEIFTTMEFPDKNAIEYGNLCYLGDKIALFTEVASRDDHLRARAYYKSYDIWVLNERGGGGVKESWTKLHSITANRQLPPPRSNNREFALLETKGDAHTWDNWDYKLELFNLVTKEAKGDFTNGAKVVKGNVYQESLVSIVGGGKGAAVDRLMYQINIEEASPIEDSVFCLDALFKQDLYL